MRKSLILPLIAIGGGASYAAGVTEGGHWPWQRRPVHLALAGDFDLAQQSDSTSRRVEAVGILDADAFNQRYERYTPLGLPKSGAIRAKKLTIRG